MDTEGENGDQSTAGTEGEDGTGDSDRDPGMIAGDDMVIDSSPTEGGGELTDSVGEAESVSGCDLSQGRRSSSHHAFFFLLFIFAFISRWIRFGESHRQ
jgi:hypothetical protein